MRKGNYIRLRVCYRISGSRGPIPRQGYHNWSPTTSESQHTLWTPSLKLEKDNEWSKKTFDLVDWDSLHTVIISTPSYHRISISKLCHGLWNTNFQNSKFYNHSAACPVCSNTDESLSHVFSCNSSSAQVGRGKAGTELRTRLVTLQTPAKLVESMLLERPIILLWPRRGSTGRVIGQHMSRACQQETVLSK